MLYRFQGYQSYMHGEQGGHCVSYRLGHGPSEVVAETEPIRECLDPRRLVGGECSARGGGRVHEATLPCRPEPPRDCAARLIPPHPPIYGGVVVPLLVTRWAEMIRQVPLIVLDQPVHACLVFPGRDRR